MKAPAVQLANVSKSFAENPAVHSLDLELESEHILALVGPSGCGKTTVLRTIAGFERIDEGSIHLAGELVSSTTSSTPPEKRGIGVVFQDYALFPHLTTKENVAFGLPRRKSKENRAQVESMLNLVGLDLRAERFPHELSGGERQRVALARALLPRPILILLDEPFSNLDADLRLKMREDVRVILKATHATAIFVTHDQEEALYMGDRLAVMNKGLIEQVGTPEEIYHQPATRFVAEFMGNTDFLPGTVAAKGLNTEIGTLKQSVTKPVGTEVEIAMRADDVQFEPKAGSKSIILARHFRGGHNLYRLRLPSGRLLHAYKPHNDIYRPGTPVKIWAEPGHELACFLDGKLLN
jgi:iron(III) transport system ATP-binding protein